LLLRLVVARDRPPIAVTARPLGANVSAKSAFTKCERPKRVDSNIEWQLMAPSLYDGSWARKQTFATFPKIAIFGNDLKRIALRQSVYSPEGLARRLCVIIGLTKKILNRPGIPYRRARPDSSRLRAPH